MCAVAGLAAAQGTAAPAGAGDGRLMAQGVRIPFDHDDEGRVKSEVFAERATVPDAEGETFAEKVRIVLSNDANDTNATVIVTDACRINFSNKTVRSNSPIRLDQPGFTMTGNGFRWSGVTEQMKILRDARVVTTRSFIEQRHGKSSAPTVLPGFRKEGY
jgi:hypothetical protein